jgi:hypothetical protein
MPILLVNVPHPAIGSPIPTIISRPQRTADCEQAKRERRPGMREAA